MVNLSKKIIIGWQEWCALPNLGIPAIKAKIDTGAKTSALHAFNIKPIRKGRHLYVKFSIHPLQGNLDISMNCKSLVIDERVVMSSNGHKEERFVISTPVIINGKIWNIELTLSNRDPLKFRMLLGREALGSRTIIEPWRTYCQGKITKKTLSELYAKHHDIPLLD